MKVVRVAALKLAIRILESSQHHLRSLGKITYTNVFIQAWSVISTGTTISETGQLCMGAGEPLSVWVAVCICIANWKAKSKHSTLQS